MNDVTDKCLYTDKKSYEYGFNIYSGTHKYLCQITGNNIIPAVHTSKKASGSKQQKTAAHIVF